MVLRNCRRLHTNTFYHFAVVSFSVLSFLRLLTKVFYTMKFSRFSRSFGPCMPRLFILACFNILLSALNFVNLFFAFFRLFFLTVKTYVTLWKILSYYPATRSGLLKSRLVFAVRLYRFSCFRTCFFSSVSFVNTFLPYRIFPSSRCERSAFPFCHGEYGLVLLIRIPKLSATFRNLPLLSVRSS